jgi:hypothetical protein
MGRIPVHYASRSSGLSVAAEPQLKVLVILIASRRSLSTRPEVASNPLIERAKNDVAGCQSLKGTVSLCSDSATL